MSAYYKRVELIEGEPVVFVGVHALRWHQEWGEPSVGFLDAPEIDEKIASLEARLAEALERNAKLQYELGRSFDNDFGKYKTHHR